MKRAQYNLGKGIWGTTRPNHGYLRYEKNHNNFNVWHTLTEIEENVSEHATELLRQLSRVATSWFLGCQTNQVGLLVVMRWLGFFCLRFWRGVWLPWPFNVSP